MPLNQHLFQRKMIFWIFLRSDARKKNSQVSLSHMSEKKGSKKGNKDRGEEGLEEELSSSSNSSSKEQQEKVDENEEGGEEEDSKQNSSNGKKKGKGGKDGKGGKKSSKLSNSKESDKKSNVVLKVGMVGDSQIGKTSLMVKYVEGQFDEDYIQTLGVNFMEKSVNIRNSEITFSIWDLGGNKREKTEKMEKENSENSGENSG
eukprot:TRINITY_DN3319_c1_g1_i15.p1 TRINITY_DN3319_c1_g1~~TRINITY_DN3319_c1_g1_i15.p1  ORF type:complete len:203 (-),score=79.21 TRINITY_DN3319_c1_g1_i15:471-1079(-)